MRRVGGDKVVRGIVALAVASCLFAPATVSSAVPSTLVAPTLTPAQASLQEKLAEYEANARELQRTREDVAQTQTEIADASNSLDAARSALASRVVEMYRTPQAGIVEMLFTASSIQDLFFRMSFLARMADNDAYTLKKVRLAQTEESWLEQGQQLRVAQLEKQQAVLDQEQKEIVAEVTANPSVLTALPVAAPASADTPASSGSVPAGSSPKGSFSRETVISEAKFRAPHSMSAADIQAFLATQPGALKNYCGPDHTGVTKTAAQMIADASVNFNVSPKVILATLQKEQSLLSTKNPSQSQFNGAMGAGMPDSGNNVSSMQGFGNQIWWGAQKQNKNALDWHQGAYENVDGTNVYPTNEGTFAQYRYTPHFGGVTSFWLIYWRYFGDPL